MFVCVVLFFVILHTLAFSKYQLIFMDLIDSEKLKQYSLALDDLAKNNSTDIFPNKDGQHAAIAIAKILKYSKKNVVIFDDDLKGDIVSKDEIESFRSSVIDFVNRNGKLKIVISDKNEESDSKELKLFLEVLKKLFPEQVFIKLATQQFKVSMKEIYKEKINFVVGDKNKFRLEKFGENSTEEKTREARGSFNNEKIATELLNAFNQKYLDCPDYFTPQA